MSRSDGGPAFPRPHSETGNYAHTSPQAAQGGMTLRDYFAGQALAGMLADGVPTTGTAEAQLFWARHAYSLADAMLEARETR